ncbi:HTH-type transcriptional regulator GltR [Sporomusa rhizae]|uniref:LysR family transcriptional regulator n=1 Tax=Sporomusa rhizae TaxID=357999 RepID=UPI00352A16CF
MDTRELRTFVTIAKHGSFTKAATELGYAQSTITGQIRTLEAELGTRLFERIGRRTFLTSTAQKLMGYAQTILSLSNEMTSLANLNNMPQGALRVASSESLLSTRLPSLLAEYHRLYPSVELILKYGNYGSYLQALRENEIDVCLLLDQQIVDADFIPVIAVSEPIGLFGSPHHRLAACGKVSVSDLSDETLILGEADCSYRRLLELSMSKEGIRPKSILEIDSVEIIRQLVAGNLGITVLPRVTVRNFLEKNELIELEWQGPPFNLKTQLLYHKDKWISPALEAFLELSANYFT